MRALLVRAGQMNRKRQMTTRTSTLLGHTRKPLTSYLSFRSMQRTATAIQFWMPWIALGIDTPCGSSAQKRDASWRLSSRIGIPTLSLRWVHSWATLLSAQQGP